MEFRTKIEIDKPHFQIEPCEEILFVGSCFADAIGRRFSDEGFPATINPYGVMYNPASILHTIERWIPTQLEKGNLPRIVFLTLGTNHVYRLKSTGEIVDNCEKRPQKLFQEEVLSVDSCVDYLRQAVLLLQKHRSDIQVVFTVSPIRYRKYGYHESQLSKAILLLAVDKLMRPESLDHLENLETLDNSRLSYFPAYELILDELRDYRFYASDMLHPSEQAVGYIWERLVDSCFSPAACQYLEEWRPIKQALAHKPFNPESKEYQAFQAHTQELLAAFRQKYSIR